MYPNRPLIWYLTAGSQTPYYDGDYLVYFATPMLQDGDHTINITVTTANATNLYIFDYFAFTPTPGLYSSGLETTSMRPTSTSAIESSSETPVGAIVGGVVGGIAGIVVLLIAGYYFMKMKRKSGGGQAYYFDKPNPSDVLAGEGPY